MSSCEKVPSSLLYCEARPHNGGGQRHTFILPTPRFSSFQTSQTLEQRDQMPPSLSPFLSLPLHPPSLLPTNLCYPSSPSCSQERCPSWHPSAVAAVRLLNGHETTAQRESDQTQHPTNTKCGQMNCRTAYRQHVRVV